LLTTALLAVSVITASAQGLPDADQAKEANKCQIIVERTGADVAVETLDALQDCIGPVFKCVQTKPGDAGCLDKARKGCNDQLDAAAAESARMFDAIARKCASGVTVEALLDPLGLNFEAVQAECKSEFGVEVTDTSSLGTCLALQQSCELQRMFAFDIPRAASLLEVAGVDPARRAALTCLTPYGGDGQGVGDPRGFGRVVEKCASTIMNSGTKLVDASLKALGRCLDTTFTCIEVKHDSSDFPACLEKARKRCDVEFANLATASAKPGVALEKVCGDVDFETLRDASGLLLEALATDCKLLGGEDPVTLSAYTDCLVRNHRCGVAELSRFKEPRAEELLGQVGRSLNDVCTLPTPTPTATRTPTPTVTATGVPTVTVVPATATPPIATTPTSTTTPPPTATPTATATPTPTATATPCHDTFEPNAFPGSGRSLNTQCGQNGCTDDGYELDVKGNISTATDNDFYTWDVQDLPQHNFQIIAQLKNLPKGVNYDLYLYRRNGDVFEQIDASNADRDSNETVRYDGIDEDGVNTGQYGIEVRRVSGSSCTAYTLEIQDGN
jgi:hypothetical protein